jgi:hypothetical protein
MVRLTLLITTLCLVGCSAEDSCQSSISFADSKKAAGVVEWIDKRVFDVPPPKEYRTGGVLVNYGGVSIKMAFFSETGIHESGFKQVDVIGSYSSPDGVFLSKEPGVGVLIARNDVMQLISGKKRLAINLVKQSSRRSAVLCRPSHL